MIRKAVIPAAGSGTRFLPATKAQPKEMLPIIDTPTIQFVVQEAAESGIDDILIITGKGKRAIEDHFDRNFELERILQDKQEESLYNEIRQTGELASIHFIRQKKLNGLGDAIYQARRHVGDEPFAVLLGDTIIGSDVPATKQLIACYEEFQEPVVAVEEVPREKVIRYGIIDGREINGNVQKISSVVEKPSVEESPSNLAIAGRYILTPDIFGILENLPRGKNNEVQLTDAIMILCERHTVYSQKIDGKRYDIGNKMDYLKTQVEYGLKRDEFSKEFREFLKEMLDSTDST